MSFLDKSGLQRLWDNLKSFFATKEEISDFVSKTDNSDVFGNSDNMSGGAYLPGLVPGGHPNYTANMYLKGDGNWDKPSTQVATGTFTLASNGTSATTINFGFVPTMIKVWVNDATAASSTGRAIGCLAAVLPYSGSGTSFTNPLLSAVQGSMSSDGTAWRAMGYKGSYLYEAYR